MPPATPESGPSAPLGPVRGCTEDDLASTFDLAVIGGGIYGVATLLEAGRRGLRAVLFEADDFGGGVSWSSHRIIHGGLRYLQKLDIARFRESVRERRWFMETFPESIKPLGCLVPLPGTGTRRPSLFACAALMNNGLNALFGGKSERIAPARLTTPSHLCDAAAGVLMGTVRGVGSWQDGLMVSSERVLMCMLRKACDLGGRAMRDVRVVGLRTDEEIVLDGATSAGGEISVRAKRVINCSGPASGAVAQLLGGAYPALFEPMRAFNVLLDVDPMLTEAMALDVPSLDGRMLFVVPGPSGLAIGTWEEPADGHVEPTRRSVDQLLAAASEVLGRMDLAFDRVSAVWSGLLPRAAGNSLTPSDRPVIVDHGVAGGEAGAFSVSGVKYTTARRVADQVLGVAFPGTASSRAVGPISDPLLDAGWVSTPPDAASTEALVRAMIRDESAQSVDDVCRRRTTWYASPDKLRRVSHSIGAAFGLDAVSAEQAVEESLSAARAVRDEI